MPKAKKHRHNRAYRVMELLEKGQLRAVPMGNDRILKILERENPALPPVKKGQRKIKEKRMGYPRGCFFNSRWMEIRPNWDVWDLVKDIDPTVDIQAKRDLAEKAIAYFEGSWHIMIYEVVTGLTKLLRQQVHRDAHYENEKARKEPLVLAIEKRFAEHALNLANLTAGELSELRTLQNRISARLRDITLIRSQLAFRKFYVYAVADATAAEISSIGKSLGLAVANPGSLTAMNADAFLMRFAERLEVLYSADMWREMSWTRWNILEAITNVLERQPLRARDHLAKAVGHLQKAAIKLSSWADSLPVEERKFIGRY